MFSLLLLFSFAYIQIRCELKQLYEDFNQLSITNLNNWKCLNLLDPNIYKCLAGMDLIKVDKNCAEIKHQIQDILPHFEKSFIQKYKLQIYIDIYCYGELDNDDNLKITIDEEQIWQTENTFLPLQRKPLGKSHQCTSYNEGFNYQLRKTVYHLLNHDSNHLTLELSSTLSADFDNESYLFRNLQIFYNQCFKTCKTCDNDQQCTSCYDDIPLKSGTCSSCQGKNNFTFLLIPQGCVVQCPDGYSYDKDKVCYENQKLITYSPSQLTKIKGDYQISGNLESSAILLRLTLKLELQGRATVNLNMNQAKIASISRSHIKSNLKYNYLQVMQNQIMVEFDAPINSEAFIIIIDGKQKNKDFSFVPELKIYFIIFNIKDNIQILYIQYLISKFNSVPQYNIQFVP